MAIQDSAIGATWQPEWHHFIDEDTGRRVEQLTDAPGNSYPLYYFIPTISADGNYLIFHSERTGWVQLHRLDLTTGEIVQLTAGRTRDSGWALWCEWHLRGIYNHLSTLNSARNEAYYFQDDERHATHIFATNVGTLENRVLAPLPGNRIPIGQNSVSPDGSRFAYIHADRERFTRALQDREALTNMNLFDFRQQHQEFRNACGTVTLEVVDTATGTSRSVIETDFHFHHVIFVDNNLMLVNHPKDCAGMWTVDVDGGNVRHLRPHDAPGANAAQVIHQLITERGIFYEAVDSNGANYFGRYDLSTDTWEETLLPLTGYVHTGFDPAGRFLFVEHDGATHDLLSVHHPRHHDRLELRVVRRLRASGFGQRRHAHPFLGPDRRWLYFSDDDANGFRQIFRVYVADIVDLDEYW